MFGTWIRYKIRRRLATRAVQQIESARAFTSPDHLTSLNNCLSPRRPVGDLPTNCRYGKFSEVHNRNPVKHILHEVGCASGRRCLPSMTPCCHKITCTALNGKHWPGGRADTKCTLWCSRCSRYSGKDLRVSVIILQEPEGMGYLDQQLEDSGSSLPDLQSLDLVSWFGM